MRTSRHIVGVVADANALLSAAIGKAALAVFTEFELEVHACRYNCDEVEEYLPQLSAKYNLPSKLVQLHWQLLPVRIHEQRDYERQLDRARRKLAKRDPDDAHPLALALMLELPVWSNDRDLREQGVECFTTAELLGVLGRQAEKR